MIAWTRERSKSSSKKRMDALPAKFKKLIHNVAVIVEDYPSLDDTRRSVGAPSRSAILGALSRRPLPAPRPVLRKPAARRHRHLSEAHRKHLRHRGRGPGAGPGHRRSTRSAIISASATGSCARSNGRLTAEPSAADLRKRRPEMAKHSPASMPPSSTPFRR